MISTTHVAYSQQIQHCSLYDSEITNNTISILYTRNQPAVHLRNRSRTKTVKFSTFVAADLSAQRSPQQRRVNKDRHSQGRSWGTFWVI